MISNPKSSLSFARRWICKVWTGISEPEKLFFFGWYQLQILAIPVSHSAISMSNTTSELCKDTLTLLWECHNHQRWWQIFHFIRPGLLWGISGAGGKREVENEVTIGCRESLMHSAWGWAAESWEPWHTSPPYWCWALFGSCSGNFQNRPINIQSWVRPLLPFFAKLNIQGPAEYHSLSLLQLLGTCCLCKWFCLS